MLWVNNTFLDLKYKINFLLDRSNLKFNNVSIYTYYLIYNKNLNNYLVFGNKFGD